MTAPPAQPAVGTDRVVRGVRDPRRLQVVTDVRGHTAHAAVDLAAVIDALLAGCAIPGAAVSLVTPGVQIYPAEAGIGASRSVIDDDLSLSAAVVDSGRPVIVEDLLQHLTYWANPFVQQGRIASFAGEPLVIGGAVLGAVSIFDRKPRQFSQEQLAALHRQAEVAGAVLEGHRQGRLFQDRYFQDRYRQGRPIGGRRIAPVEDGRGDEQRGYSAHVHQATGRLMARFSVGPTEALLRLREQAERLGRPLSALAHDVAAGHWAAFEDGHESAVGPTADTDLVLMREHALASPAGPGDGRLDGHG